MLGMTFHKEKHFWLASNTESTPGYLTALQEHCSIICTMRQSVWLHNKLRTLWLRKSSWDYQSQLSDILYTKKMQKPPNEEKISFNWTSRWRTLFMIGDDILSLSISSVFVVTCHTEGASYYQKRRRWVVRLWEATLKDDHICTCMPRFARLLWCHTCYSV